MTRAVRPLLLALALAASAAGAGPTNAVAWRHGSLPRWETSASGPLRPLPEGTAYTATNLIMTWAGYTFGAARNGYNDHIYVEPATNTTELTVCSWLALSDADCGSSPNGSNITRRASNAMPSLYYTPNVERSAPDLLGGAWGWGGSAVTVSGTNAFDYAFAGGVTFLECVEMDGNQQIDLDFTFTPRHKMSVDWQWTQVEPKQQRIFNQRPNPGLHIELYINGSGNHGYAYERDNLTGWKSNSNKMTTSRYTYTFDGPGRKLYRDTTAYGNLDNLSAMTDADCGTVPMSIGRYQSTDDRLGPRAKCYGVKVWRSGVLERDLRPVVDSAGPGLLDVLHGRIFHSATSSNLIAGPVRDPAADERCYSLAWNGGTTGTNCFPRGCYTIAWTNLSADMTLSAGGETVALEAPSGNRNIVPGEGAGFALVGSGTAHVGISRMKIEPIYQTHAGGSGSTGSTGSWDARMVGTNWCFVAHRIHLDASTHTNAVDIIHPGGPASSWGAAPELPPDGCGALRTNGLYQLVYAALGDLQASYIYEWDRRQFSRWLSDAEIAAVYADGMRVRTAMGYPTCIVTNAVYPPGASGLQTSPTLSGARKNWYASALLATNSPLPAVDENVVVDGLAIPEGLKSTLRSEDEIFVGEQPVLEALVARYRDGLSPTHIPVYAEHDRTRPCGRVTDLWHVPGSGVWVRMILDENAAGDGPYLSPELVTARAGIAGTGISAIIPWRLTGLAITADPALAGTEYGPSAGRPYPTR